MNLAAMRAQVDRRTGKAQDVPAATAYINEAVQIISSARNWPWLDGVSTFTASAASTALPADWAETRSINVNGFEAQRVATADADQYNFLDSFELYAYAVEGGSLYLYPVNTPTSTTAVTHRYVKTEPAMSADSDVPLIPAVYHSFICDLASALFLERIAPSRSDFYHKRYEQGLRQMIQGARRAGGPTRIRVRPGGWY